MAKCREEATGVPPVKPFSEDKFSDKMDLCLTDTAIKAGSGGMLGALTSLLFIRGRWPMIAGVGIGIGLAWANCEHSLNEEINKHKV